MRVKYVSVVSFLSFLFFINLLDEILYFWAIVIVL